jgi:tRNA-2-methylthio-N6-dimethylallyladenosine synthase
VDLIFGTHLLGQFPKLLFEVLADGKRVLDLSEQENEIPEGLPIKREGSLKAWLPIMYGCNNFCTYCIVPHVRGRERSRKSENILKECRELVTAGYKEITLLGQNVNSYGKGLEEQITFPQLLEKIAQIPGDFRIRFMTSHPKDATKELIDVMAKEDKICKHFHLPVQCGSDEILKRMNRHYNKEQYLRLVDYAREKMPDISFTSDIIVGFPGETEADFEQTLDLIRRVSYDSLYTFIYSPRVGTAAASMPDPISAEEKSRWFRKLLAVQNEIGANRLKAYEGKVLRVLVDGTAKEEGKVSGRTDTNMVVTIPGTEDLIGQFVTVKIEHAKNCALEGNLLSAAEK